MPRRTGTEISEQVHIGQRIAVGLIALSLGLTSLALGLAFLNSPAALLVLPTQTQSVPSDATAVTLTWTAPGDDGDVGTATSYDIRYSTSPITDANFSSATAVSSPPTPLAAGSTESYTVTNLQPSTTYFFALKTSDEAGNVSAISNIATKTTAAAVVACTPTYSCSSWSACTSGTQTRTCQVTNGCNSNLGSPITSQKCTVSTSSTTDTTIKNPLIVAGVAKRTIPVVRTINPYTHRTLREFLVMPRNDRNGVFVAAGDVTGDHVADIIVGSGIGSDPVVKIFTAAGQQLFQFNPYPTSRGIGVSVATGDVDGDGVDEILTIPARSAAQIRIFKYNASSHRVTAVAQAFAYAPSQRNGFTIAAGDTNLDGRDEIIVAARTRALTVSVFDLNDQKQIVRVSKFSPYGLLFTSGITIATGDVNGDGHSDILTVGGPSYWSDVKAFTLHGSLIAHFLPAPTSYRGGVDLAAFDVNQDGRDEVITGNYSGGDPILDAFRYNSLTKRFDHPLYFPAFPRTMQDGLRLDATPHN